MKYLLILVLLSCKSQSGRKSVSKKDLSPGKNSANSLDVGYGRVLETNPIIFTGDSSLNAPVDIASLLKEEQDFITTNALLSSSCVPSATNALSISDCYSVTQNRHANFTSPIEGKWAFTPNSSEWLEVHTFYHVDKAIKRFLAGLQTAFTQSQTITSYTSFPSTLYSDKNYWYKTLFNSLTTVHSLKVYSECKDKGSPYFDPAVFFLCLNADKEIENFYFAQDPSIIYHELGHAFVKIMMNTRNMAAGLVERTDLGTLFYDEGGSINEGIADFFSYYINGRTHFGEWGLGRFYEASRPIEEDDPLHVHGLSSDSFERLSYPHFINYDPNNPKDKLEDIHYTGQIASHFMVALSKELEAQCSLSFEQSTDAVLYALAETLGEIGDITAQGTSHLATTNNVNHSNTQVNLTNNFQSSTTTSLGQFWSEVMTPGNFRRFFQTFARYAYRMLENDLVTCTGSYGRDEIEKLLDKYGLLLFNTYNEDLNNATTGHSNSPTRQSITLTNRRNSLLIPKESLILDPRYNAPRGFIFDDPKTISTMITNLATQRGIQISPLISRTAGKNLELHYNNGNGLVSPGEVVGLTLNLYNDSQIPMGSVQMLANDWDHGKLEDSSILKDSSGNNLKVLHPCNTFEDEFPLSTEGAASSDADPAVDNDCGKINQTEGTDGKDTFLPVCMVRYASENETLWVDQKTFAIKSFENEGDEDFVLKNRCLHEDKSPYDCLIRAIPGARQAIFSRIDPQKTWAQTISEKSAPNFGSHNIVLFEVSPFVPPGTSFLCRFRLRFTNCKDCWEDSTNSNDDFLDYEYSGNTPFRILHLEFTVTD